MLGSILPSSYHHHSSSLASAFSQPRTSRQSGAPPLSCGMWATASILAIEGGIRVGGTAGETQDVGDPPGASRQRATTKVVAHFHPSTHPFHHHLPRVQERDGGGVFRGFGPISPPRHPRWSPHHLPHMQERDGGGVLRGFDPCLLPRPRSIPFAPPPPPSRAKARRRWPFMGF